jgi:TatD DNase family protein
LNILFDTHCHLCLDEFREDLDSVIKRAFDRGVQYILIPGLDLRTSRRAIWISEKYQSIFAAIGFHPHTEGKWDSQTAKEFEELSRHPKVAAIGEIGLDQYRTEASLEEQEIRLRAQLVLAKGVQKPVLLHTRGETERLLRILSEIDQTSNSLPPLKGVFHAYGGDQEILAFAERNHFYLGIGGIITFPKSEQLQQMASKILPSVILETDSPVLAPNPYRGKRNEPAYLPIICQHLAEITERTEEEISNLSTQNAISLLGVK